jgi:hypothetical protein
MILYKYYMVGVLPNIMAGFAESVRNDMSCGSAILLIPPSFTFILKEMSS